jgi:hypothetical protein
MLVHFLFAVKDFYSLLETLLRDRNLAIGPGSADGGTMPHIRDAHKMQRRLMAECSAIPMKRDFHGEYSYRMILASALDLCMMRAFVA